MDGRFRNRHLEGAGPEPAPAPASAAAAAPAVGDDGSLGDGDLFDPGGPGLQPASQASSHFPLEPVTGATLYRLELARRQALGRRGLLPTGCPELDDHVLVRGGFERGTVVGLSAEAMDMALLMGLQTLAHNLVAAHSAARLPLRAAIITPLAPPAILPQLLDVLQAQVRAQTPSAQEGPDTGADEMANRCLQHISLSRIFDVEGLYDVLRELEVPPESPVGAEVHPAPTLDRDDDDDLGFWDAPAPGQGQESDSASDGAPEPTLAPELPSAPHRDPSKSLPAAEHGPLRTGRTEVMDSEDEGNLLSSSSPLSSPPPSSDPPIVSSQGGAPERVDVEQAKAEEAATWHEATSRISGERDSGGQGPEDEACRTSPFHPEHGPSQGIPDIILITHMPTLLSHLFTSRDKSAAHTTIQLLSTHLRSLSRTAGSLVVLLNSTSTSTANTTAAAALDSASPWPGRPPFAPGVTGSRPLDPTLRSIFNPAAPGRQNKPAFGLTFTQLLDLHLLCTKMPRTRLDAAAGGGLARHAWAVEVLLDEEGLWNASDGDNPPDQRVDREQRWGAVDVRDGVRIIDAFGKRHV